MEHGVRFGIVVAVLPTPTAQAGSQAGTLLRKARERMGLTFRDVEQASYRLAERRRRPEFIVHISRLADIENHGVVPSLHRLYALCTIYHLELTEALSWFGLSNDDMYVSGGEFPGARTHLAAPPLQVRIPVRLDPGFNPNRTDDFTRRVQSWGFLEPALSSSRQKYWVGYIGLEDRTMDPLLRPGSLVLVDPSRQDVRNSGWNNEFERPIYFLDTRSGYNCGWCQRDGDNLILQPHPLSDCPGRVFRRPTQAEVIGQVVGLGMLLVPG
jgi:transcriptional regulator with XRE-family HTH domain